MKRVNDVMTRNVEVLPPEATLETVAKKMRELNIGALPVCNGERLEGLITDRDIVIHVCAEDLKPSDVEARDVMTKPIVYCFEDQDVEEAARVMEIRKIRRLVVLNREKKLVGILSLGDLAVRGGDGSLTGETLEKIAS